MKSVSLLVNVGLIVLLLLLIRYFVILPYEREVGWIEDYCKARCPEVLKENKTWIMIGCGACCDCVNEKVVQCKEILNK